MCFEILMRIHYKKMRGFYASFQYSPKILKKVVNFLREGR